MSDSKDYYKILEIDKNASQEEIKKNYKKLALKYHPDKNKDPEAENIFKKISIAYEILSSEDNRKRYDNGEINNINNTNANDIISQMFNAHFNFNFGGDINATTNLKKKDSIHIMNISLQDVHTGISKTFKIILTKQCFDCNKKCNNCNGTGIMSIAHQIGPFSQIIQQSCNACTSGITKVVNQSCKFCNGVGSKNVEEICILNISKNIISNSFIKFERFGEQPLKHNEIPGDLLFQIIINDDPYFVRDTCNNENLIFKLKLTLGETFIGKIINIPHFDGIIEINTKTFGIINPNKKYHLTGKGLGGKGDLILIFEIIYTDIFLNDEQILLLENTFKQINFV